MGKRYNTKYTKELIEAAVKKCNSISAVCRTFGISRSSSSVTAMSNRIKKFKINISHFGGQGWRKGMPSDNKKTWQQHLVNRNDKTRKNAKILRRCLIESGVEYKCVKCPNRGEWMGQKITLEIDHINEKCDDDRKENLQFLCPNCHAVKTYNLNAQVM